MDNEVQKIIETYFKLNSLKYKYNDDYNEYNGSGTIASKIFGSSMLAVGLCSDIFIKNDMNAVIKNILLSEIDKNIHFKLDDYEDDIIAKMAINCEENYEYMKTVIESINRLSAHNIYNFYMITNKLKKTDRTGWIYWQVKANKLEKIAEHVYGTCVLAILMGKLKPNINIDKVISMLMLHETEEVLIGDITVFDKTSPEDKEKMGHMAIKKVFSNFGKANDLINLILEFDDKETDEAKFAYMCDKLEADLQAIAYEQMGYNHMDNQESNPAYNSPKVQEIIKNGAQTVAEVWYEFDKDKFVQDESFSKVLKYAIKKES